VAHSEFCPGYVLVLSGPVILLFADHAAAAPCGLCMIEGATLQKGGIIPRDSPPFMIKLSGNVPKVPFRFAIRRASGLALEFTADSEPELLRWIDAIVRSKFLADRIEDYPLVPVPEAVDAVPDMSRPTVIGYAQQQHSGPPATYPQPMPHPTPHPMPHPTPLPMSQPMSPTPRSGQPSVFGGPPPPMGAFPPRGPNGELPPGFAPQPVHSPPPGYNPHLIPPAPAHPHTSSPVPSPPAFMAPIMPQQTGGPRPVSPAPAPAPAPAPVMSYAQPVAASAQQSTAPQTGGSGEASLVCASCGHQLRPTARFCPSCGVSR
jgi:hypothetical protein